MDADGPLGISDFIYTELVQARTTGYVRAEEQPKLAGALQSIHMATGVRPDILATAACDLAAAIAHVQGAPPRAEQLAAVLSNAAKASGGDPYTFRAAMVEGSAPDALRAQLAAYQAQFPLGEISAPRAAAAALMDASSALERSFCLLEVGDVRGFEAVLPEVRERVGEARAGIAQATLGDEPAHMVDVQRLRLAHAHLTQGREIGAWGVALGRVVSVDGQLTASTRDLGAQLSLPEGVRAAVRGDPALVARLQPHLGPLVRDLAVVLAARDRVMSLAGA